MHVGSRQLETRIDVISRALPGFYIGRYDVRFGGGILGKGKDSQFSS